MEQNSVNDPRYLEQRQGKLRTALIAAGLDAVTLNAGPTLSYLTGLNFHLSERPVVAIFTAESPVTMVIPGLEARKGEGLPYEAQAFTYPEDPSRWQAVFEEAAHAAGLPESAKLGVEPRRMRVLEWRFLEVSLPEAVFSSAEDLIAGLRMHKDEGEISAMRKAIEVAEKALRDTIPHIKAGMSERELASELTAQVFKHGSDPELPFAPIVSTGPNGANPHATPTDRKLAAGDLLVLDWGASLHGYFADITRTFAIGEVEVEYAKIHRIVQEANEAARTAAAPEVPCSQVDEAARDVIEQAGYGEYFTHRTGHGLGLESHEEPYMRSGNPMLLAPGMTFTIEPGIYLPGRNGVRIEDDVLITTDGLDCLTSLPRELITVG